MAGTTKIIGLLLIALGIASYFLTGRASVTALIPAFFGIPLLVLGLLAAAKEQFRMHIMHFAVLLGLLGVGGSFPGVIKLLKNDMERPAAVYAQSVMAVICLVYVVLCIRSFVQVRKNKAASGNS